jgi:DNA polymerase-3 subunit gamma/tau
VAAEGVSVIRTSLVAIARASDGGLRDAESILDQLVAFAKDSVSLDDVVSMLGWSSSRPFQSHGEIIARDAKARSEVLKRGLRRRQGLDIVLVQSSEHFRNLMVAKVAKADAQLIDLPQDICERLLQQRSPCRWRRYSTRSHPACGTGYGEAVRFDADTDRDKSGELAQRAAVGAASAPAAAAEKHAAVAAVPPPPAKPARPEAVPAPAAMPAQEKSAPSHGVGVHKPVPAARVQAPEPVAGPAVHAHSAHGAHHAVSLDAVKQQWQAIIQLISKSRMSLATFLGEGLPTEVNGHMLTVSFPKNCSLHKDSLEQKSNKDMIEKRFAEVLGVVVRLQFRLTQEERSTATIEDHPVVKSAMDMFNARLIRKIDGDIYRIHRKTYRTLIKLPGIGRRSAERIVGYLLDAPASDVQA